MRQLKGMMLTMFALACVFMLKGTAYAASNITYVDINGNPIQNGSGVNITDATTDGAFTNLNAELSSGTGTYHGKTPIAYIYDGCRSAISPQALADAAYTDNYAVKVIFEDQVDHHGTIATGGVWYIKGEEMYITGQPTALGGKLTLDDPTYVAGGSYADTTETKHLADAKFETTVPDLHYSEWTVGDGSGVQESAVFDEMTMPAAGWYEFVQTPDETYMYEIADRDDVSLDFRLEGHAQTGPWSTTVLTWTADKVSGVKRIYVSDDIELSGNVSGLFNGTVDSGTKYFKENGSANDMRDSIFTSLEDVYLYCDMSKVTSAAGMFGRIPTLKNIYVRHEKADTLVPMTNAVSLGYMFYGDKALTNGTDSFLNVMNLSGSTNLLVTSYMFGGCEAITHPNVKSYNMSSVKYAEGMFFGAKNAMLVADGNGADYDISGWNLSSAVNTVAMFSGGGEEDEISLNNPTEKMDPGLVEITDYPNVVVDEFNISGWNMSNVQMASYMFSKNGGLRQVTLGASYPALVDASGMFLRCDNMTSLTMPSSMPALKNATAMFRLAGSKAATATANLSNFSAPALEHAEFMFYGTGFTSINTDGVTGLASLKYADEMFADSKKLADLGTDALSGVTFGELISPFGMFRNCEALLKVDTRNWNMSKALILDYMFQNTPNLTTGVDVSGWGIAVCTSMECFADGNGMGTFDCSAWTTRYIENYAFAFHDNPNVTLIKMPTAANALSSAVTICGMFADDPALLTANLAQGWPTLKYANGVFANDESLRTATVENLIKAGVVDMSYFMKNCKAITSFNTEGWVTTAVKYMQGAWDGCENLASIDIGAGITTNNVLDVGTLFRNCYVLSGSTINEFLSKFESAAKLQDVYEMVKNCYALTTLDMSTMNLSNTTELRRLACMEDNSSYATNKLITIKLPESILTADSVVLKDDDNTSINMFWVVGDEADENDDLLTTLYVNGTPGDNLKAYIFGGSNGDNDNRSFVKYVGRTINGNDIGVYELADPTDTAAMKINATSTFYTGGTDPSSATVVPLQYTWTKNGSSIAAADEDTYTANLSGTYVANAYPGLLSLSNAKKSATFLIGSSIAGITAEYTGDPVAVGKEYSLDDVVVKLVDTDGNEITLTPDDYTVNSKKVTKQGDNEYTVTYTSGGTDYTAKFKVPGVREIGSITATYTGPSVLVGKEYDPEYVTVMAYYADDTSKKEGFEVEPTSLSSLKVTTAGDNTYTATYKDTATGKSFTAPYKVNGYKTITSISATYTGDKIKVGNKYNKDDVKVTLYYADGSGSATTTNFTVDSLTVTAEGGNSYTASYRDPFGNVYTAGFSVPGYKDAESSSSSSSTPQSSNATGSTTSTVVAPSQQYAAAKSTVKQGKSTGVVQTGRTGKTVLYVVAIIALLGIIVGMGVLKKKDRH